MATVKPKMTKKSPSARMFPLSVIQFCGPKICLQFADRTHCGTKIGGTVLVMYSVCWAHGVDLQRDVPSGASRNTGASPDRHSGRDAETHEMGACVGVP